MTFDNARSDGDIRYDFHGNEYCICPATLNRHVDFQIACSSCFVTGCNRLGAIGLNHYGDSLPLERRPACGARTRDGFKCQEKVVPSRTKCRLHGGASTGPRTQAGKERIAQSQRDRWAALRKSSV